ncbi:MAG: hypothetical protein K9N48_04485 [Verrucomicrobia bacterium]|nr:hypothetical protein [Verrucomicrobiota bacterium]MCF7709452.1 hypothetical protein [Verrucomicrobiota bacterium]
MKTREFPYANKTIIIRYTVLLVVLTAAVFRGDTSTSYAQELGFTAVRATVDFSKKLRAWDGFGFNYVETAQTRNPVDDPQDYGGFSLLDTKEKGEIIDMIFGEDGLKVGIVKMFLDPFHQAAPGGEFDHVNTTKNMRFFVREGLKKTRARGDNLTIITTLYGPPGFMTKQKTFRGRDLDPEFKDDLAAYIIDWVKFLREKEGFPVKYISLHNEGEDWRRWNEEGITDWPGHDYNLFWPPEQVVEFIKMLPDMLEEAGLSDVEVTPGETTNWYRFGTWGYASAIAYDSAALDNLGLITSHGFYSGSYGRWFGEHKSTGIDLLRSKRPELHVWVTSTSWSNMDAENIKEMHGNIYTAKVNGITPWAGIQRPTQWVKGDPNPGCAFYVHEDGTYDVRRGYYFYKQITRAGQPGMSVAHTTAMDSEIAVIAFSKNKTSHPDAFIVTNISNSPKKIAVEISGTASEAFHAFRTTNNENDLYDDIGAFELEENRIVYNAPGGSVTTFFGDKR